MIRASFGKSVARSTLLGGLALLAVPAIAGCEAGNNAPTLEFHDAAAGAYQTTGPVTVSNAFVLGAPSGSSLPAGSSASLFVALFNTGTSGDRLESASAPGVASSVQIKGGSVAIPANGAADLTGPEPSLVLKGLTSPLQNGANIPVTLTFANAGTVSLNIPVEPQSFYWSTYSPAAASPSASPSVTPPVIPGGTATGTAQAKPGASATPTGTAKATATATATATPSPSKTR